MAKKKLNFKSNPLFSGPSLHQRVSEGSPYREVAIEDIDVDPDQPRGIFNQDSIKELAESIEIHGLISPILVRALDGGTFRLVAGERRLRAFQLLKKKSIPVLVDQNQQEEGSVRLAKQLVENIQRQDLSAMEKALAIGQLRDKHKWSVREIAKQLGSSKSSVQRHIEILSYPSDLQEALLTGVSETKIAVLSKITDSRERKSLLKKVNDYTRSELLEKVRVILGEVSHGGTVDKKPGKKRKISTEDRRIVDELQKSLGTKVQVLRKKDKKGQGKISIEFYSNDELNEIYQRLI